MPPKKKARRSSRAASGLPGNLAEGVTAERNPAPPVEDGLSGLENDQWTDEQEAALFKGMVRWKPVGMHKYFRMIALSQYLHNHGYDISKNDHLRVPGIWKKLDKLYNLEILDDRENAFIYASSPDNEQYDQPYCPFSLPRDEYAEMMFNKRLAPTESPSPSRTSLPPSVVSTSAAATRRASTVEDTEDPHPSPASIRETRVTRKPQSTKSTRRSQLNEVTSLPDQMSNSKASVEEGSVNAQTEDGPQTPGQTEEDEQDEHTRTVKSSGAKNMRRRSTRRKNG